MFFIGYLLSPVSLWDDVFVNVPISYVLALIVRHFSQAAFLPSMIIIYWLTNLLGFLLMRKGVKQVHLMKSNQEDASALRNDFIASVVYTVALVLLVKLNVLQIGF